jgi:hypothetical protein
VGSGSVSEPGAFLGDAQVHVCYDRGLVTHWSIGKRKEGRGAPGTRSLVAQQICSGGRRVAEEWFQKHESEVNVRGRVLCRTEPWKEDPGASEDAQSRRNAPPDLLVRS